MTKRELEKENAELLCQKNRNKSCYSCANAIERCFRNEIGCPCQKYKSYKEENAELKKRNAELRGNYVHSERALATYKTFAKEIIRDLLFHLGNTFIVSYTSKEESITKAEQFLTEVSK